jgi:hypothetical protein
MVIFREIQLKGYTGGTTILRDYIKPKRPLREGRATVYNGLENLDRYLRWIC